METETNSNVEFFRAKASDFVELHDQVDNSLKLLGSLESFLSTFQNDLSSVSGQISELQRRSKALDEQLKGRRKIERPLSSLIVDLTIPPQVATLLLDTDVGEPWIDAVSLFESKFEAIKARGRVKASKDLGNVAEGLRIVVSTKLRAFFLALLQPIRTNMSTNMHVLQTSVFLKYRSLFGFLQRESIPVAQEIQRSYISSARTYYETGFRRYIRCLNTIKGRFVERSELIGNTTGDKVESELDVDRLQNALLEGPAVTMAFMADDRSFKQPLESLFRSLLLVFMDNATAEYNFIRQFFDTEDRFPIEPLQTPFSDRGSIIGSPIMNRRVSAGGVSLLSTTGEAQISKEERIALETIWRQVMDPVIKYAEVFIKSTVEPPPPLICLLTMIRLNEAAYHEVERRQCPPVELFILNIRMTLWPLFQTEMGAHVESLKKLADSAAGTLLSRGNVRDTVVQSVVHRYAVLFTSIIALIGEEDEPMLFINLGRLRQELSRLITAQAGRIRDPTQNAAYLSTIYETMLHKLSVGPRPNIHPKAQTETAFWREREEEARRRIASSRQ